MSLTHCLLKVLQDFLGICACKNLWKFQGRAVCRHSLFFNKSFQVAGNTANEMVQPVIPFNDGTKEPELCDVSRKKRALMGLFFTFRAR